MKPTSVLPLVLVFCFLISGLSQQPKPTPPAAQNTEQKPRVDVDQDVIKINTTLVQIDAVVTRNGQQVTDLNAADFEVFEDGKSQAITNFSYISNVSAAPAATKRDPLAPPIPASVRPSDTRRTIALVVD